MFLNLTYNTSRYIRKCSLIFLLTNIEYSISKSISIILLCDYNLYINCIFAKKDNQESVVLPYGVKKACANLRTSV